jgi:hypothetical protein
LLQPALSLANIHPSHSNLMIYLLVAYALFVVLLLTVFKPWDTIAFETSKGTNGHLAWYWLDFPLVCIILWMFFFLVRYYINGDYYSLAIISTIVIVTYVIYHKTHEFGSMWCWFANFIAFLLIYKVFVKSKMFECSK